MIKALIFDFDGLLMDTETPEVHIWQEIYASHGVDFPLDTWIRSVVGSSDSNFDVAANLAAETGKKLDLPDLRQQARAARLEIQSRLPALPGTDAILNHARAINLRLAIASSSPHWWVDGYLQQLGIAGFFEFVVCREDVNQVKPAPDLYLKAIELLHLPARECLAFEDSPNGVLAAKRAGLRVVGIPNAITSQTGRLPADQILTALDEIPLEKILEFHR